MLKVNDFPRKSRLDFNIPAEVAIDSAMLKIEELGADVRLTHAVIKLQEAKDLVSEYVDEQITR